MLVKHLSYPVKTFSTPDSAKKFIAQNEVIVALLDMNFRASVTTGNEGLYWLSEFMNIAPATKYIVMTAYGEIDLAVKAIQKGATDFISKPWDNERLLTTIKNAIDLYNKGKKLDQLNSAYKSAESSFNPDEFIASSNSMKQLVRNLKKVGPTEANVLLLGANGTGKGDVARYIHYLSERKDEVFVQVDLGSISENLFEAELFGYKKGAFTDAKTDKIGRIQAAGNGTLFLDEIGNLSLGLQAKLLTVLQSKQIIPLGSHTPVNVNVRLICATNMPLYDMIAEGTFRQDLLYRINTVEVNIPLLREREGDIEALALHYLSHFAKKYQKINLQFEDSVIQKLKKYEWPGNIRELSHLIERLVIMSESDYISDKDLFLRPSIVIDKSENLNLEDLEKQAIIKALKKHQGNMTQVAKELGLGRTTLYRKLAKYEL
jgi:DNA-binding NtrC family response regulator